MSSSPVTTHNGEKRENFGFLFIFFLKDNIFTGAFFIFLFWQETIGKDKSASGQPKLWTKKCASNICTSCCSYWSRPLVLLTWPPAEVMCNATTATNRVVLHWRIKRHYLFKGRLWSPCCSLSLFVRPNKPSSLERFFGQASRSSSIQTLFVTMSPHNWKKIVCSNFTVIHEKTFLKEPCTAAYKMQLLLWPMTSLLLLPTGPKNVKLAWKFLLDVITDEKKYVTWTTVPVSEQEESSPLWKKYLHHHFLSCLIFGAVFPGEKKNMRIHIWHILDSAKLHSMRSWPYIHLVYILDILIFPREIVLDRIDLKAINVLESTWAKTFWQFCFYAWVGLFSLW